MNMKKKAVILSFVGASIFSLGLQSQQTLANTYRRDNSSRYCVSRRACWHSNKSHYYKGCYNIGVRPEDKPQAKPDVNPPPVPEVPAPEIPAPEIPAPEIPAPEVPVPDVDTKPDVNPVPVPEAKPEIDVSINNFEIRVVELTNVERAKQGLPALQLDQGLSKVAKAKSQDMQDLGYFDHTSPTYGSPFDMMRQFGITYRSAGENIAKGQRTPEEVVSAWMNSPGHRANILGNYTHIGVGYISSGNVWTQMFMTK